MPAGALAKAGLVRTSDNMKRYIYFFFCVLFIVGCAGYRTPPRDQWPTILRGASLSNMTSDAQIAKKPVFLGSGGATIDAAASRAFVEKLEFELYDSLRKPGIQVQRVGSEVVVVLVRDAFMSPDAPEISSDGADTLQIIAKILAKHNQTYIEIAGYTDAMRDKNSATAFSLDMAQRVAIAFAQNGVAPVRMFIVGRGAARPISDQTDIGRLMNRRVELRIVPVVK